MIASPKGRQILVHTHTMIDFFGGWAGIIPITLKKTLVCIAFESNSIILDQSSNKKFSSISQVHWTNINLNLGKLQQNFKQIFNNTKFSHSKAPFDVYFVDQSVTS